MRARLRKEFVGVAAGTSLGALIELRPDAPRGHGGASHKVAQNDPTPRIDRARRAANGIRRLQATPDEVAGFIERSVGEIPDGRVKQDARVRMRAGLVVDPARSRAMPVKPPRPQRPAPRHPAPCRAAEPLANAASISLTASVSVMRCTAEISRDSRSSAAS